MGVRLPFLPGYVRPAARSKQGNPQRAALLMILAEVSSAEEALCTPEEALLEIERVAEAAVGTGR
jgi:hypothetical protein